MMDDWYLEMSLVGPHGERVTMRKTLDGGTARDVYKIPPPVPGLARFEQAVALLKQWEFRKGLFIEAARRIGALLAERMEDAEGWHDVERQEPARQELAQR